MKEYGSVRLIDEFADSPLPLSRGATPSVRYAMNGHSDNSDDEFDYDWSPEPETNAGRLSRSLRSWMRYHVLKPLYPKEKPPREPVFSGRLGKTRSLPQKSVYFANSLGPDQHSRAPASLRRASSDESINTVISLLSCSSCESINKDEIILNKKKRNKRRTISRASTQTNDVTAMESKWVELANRQARSTFDRRMKAQQATNYAAAYTGYEDEEPEAYELMDSELKTLMFNSASRTGIRYINSNTLHKSGSMTNIDVAEEFPEVRPTSASANKSWGKPLDVSELKRELMNRRIAAEQAKLHEKESKKRSKRHALIHRASSSNILRTASPMSVVSQSELSVMSSDIRPHSASNKTQMTEQKSDTSEEERVTMWKGDREILEIDLNRELTSKVKHKIAVTRTALSRVSGLGENNDQKTVVGVYEEFPMHTEEDYSQKPRIIQRMRISPHLSSVIHNDIQVRMGRPRYHEIRVGDLKLWNRGQELNRAHRNLKVFNWLHSLRETEFVHKVISNIADELPNISDVFVHVESADEPDVKPLYKAYEVR